MSKKKGEGLKSFNRGFDVPDNYIIIFFVVVIAAVMTFLVPKGYYETEDVTYLMNGVEKTRTVIKDGSFQYLTDAAGKPVTEGVALFSGDGGTGFFNYMYNGIISSSAIEIIAFLMVVGGAFGIMIRTGAVEAGLIGLIRKAKGAEKLLIPVLFVLFSLGGAVFGMGEEALPFTMILCPLFVAVGYDTVIAVLVTYVATQIGFGSSWMNPFSVGIAQGIATLPGLSRSGTTITACLLAGYQRNFAVKYSFLMSIPAILGALVLELKDATDLAVSGTEVVYYVIGMAVAAVVGYVCIKTMLVIVRKKKFTVFAIYCLLVGALSIGGYFYLA